MAVPEYIKPPEKLESSFGWLSGLKDENGKLNRYGIHAYITLAINLFYFISNLAFWIWGNIWYIDNFALSLFLRKSYSFLML